MTLWWYWFLFGMLAGMILLVAVQIASGTIPNPY